MCINPENKVSNENLNVQSIREEIYGSLSRCFDGNFAKLDWADSNQLYSFGSCH